MVKMPYLFLKDEWRLIMFMDISQTSDLQQQLMPALEHFITSLK